MKRTILILTLLWLLPTAFIHAQPGTSGRPITFDEAVMLTFGENPQIEALRYEEQAAMYDRKAAFGLRLPKLNVSGVYAHLSDEIGFDVNNIRDKAQGVFTSAVNDLGLAGNPQLAPILGNVNNLFERNWGFDLVKQDIAFVGATMTIPLYTGGKINAANRAARINERTSKERGEQVRGELMSELVERYYGLLLANEAVRVREQVVRAMEAHLRDAVALEENGVIAHTERLYVEVKLAEAQRDLLDARSQAATTLSALCNTLDTEYNFIPVSNLFVMNNVPSLSNFKELALQNNPQLKQVESQRQLAVQGVAVQRAEFLPHVVGLGSARIYNYNVSDVLPNWVVGAGVSIKIFDGLQKEYKLSSAKVTVRRVEALQDKAEKDITLLVEKLYNEMQNYADRMPSVDKSLEFATEYLRAKDAGFREGVSTAVDVIDAELNVAATRIERLQTAYNYDLSLAKLLEAAGMSESFPGYAAGTNARAVTF